MCLRSKYFHFFERVLLYIPRITIDLFGKESHFFHYVNYMRVDYSCVLIRQLFLYFFDSQYLLKILILFIQVLRGMLGSNFFHSLFLFLILLLDLFTHFFHGDYFIGGRRFTVLTVYLSNTFMLLLF